MKKLKMVAGWATGIMACAAMFSLTACNNGQEAQTEETTATTDTVSTPAPAGPQVTDPQIGSIVVVANQIDVDYGQIALNKSQNKDVKDFANTMIKDHNDLIKATVDLANKLGVTPEDNPVSQSLLSGADEMKAKLNGLDGDAFNKAYIDNEVSYHEAVIQTVKDVLIPQSQNEELKQTLISVTPLLEHHLEMAKMAQAKINQ